MNSKLSDKQLLEQVKKSDMTAFRQLFEQYQPILFRHVLFQVGDNDVAHDIVQQTFISVWEHRSSLKPNLSFLAYIFRISRNLIYDSIKHHKVRERTNAFLPQLTKSEIDDPEEAAQLNFIREQIEMIINTKFPAKCREIFLLSRFEGKSNREIAESLHLSVRTVEHQISYALRLIRKKMKL